MNGNVNYHSFPRVTVRFFFRILFGIVLCIVMYGTFFSFFNAEWYQRLLSVLALALFAYMIYAGMWSTGMHDRDEIYFERMKRNPYRGLAASAVAGVPYAILNAVLLLNCYNAITAYNTALQNGEELIAFLQRSESFRLIFNLINAPFLFITLNYDYHTIGSVIIAGILLPLSIILFGGISYYLGLKNISLLQMSIYKDENQHKNEGSK